MPKAKASRSAKRRVNPSSTHSVEKRRSSGKPATADTDAVPTPASTRTTRKRVNPSNPSKAPSTTTFLAGSDKQPAMIRQAQPLITEPAPAIQELAPLSNSLQLAHELEVDLTSQTNSAVSEAFGACPPINVIPAMAVAQGNAVTPPPSAAFVSTAIPLANRVPPRVREKILGDQFIEMAQILGSDMADDAYQLQMTQQEGVPALQWATKPKKKQITVAHWTDCFTLFMAVRCERNPQESSALLQYLSTIRKLAKQGADWAYYDSRFRQLRAAGAGGHWHQIEWELWHEASFRPIKVIG